MKKILAATAAVLTLGLAVPSNAATFQYVGTFERKECDGSQRIKDCSYNGAAAIAKFTYKKGNLKRSAYNKSVFPSLDGNEFDVRPNGILGGAWDYTSGSGDPLVISTFMLKVRGKIRVYEWDESSDTSFVDIIFRPGPSRKALRRITFFEKPSSASRSQGQNNISPVPLPAAGLLMLVGLGGLGGLGAMRRRRKS